MDLIHLAWDEGLVMGCCGHSKEHSKFYNRQEVSGALESILASQETSVSG